MLCSNCFESEYHNAHISQEIVVNGAKLIIPDVECNQCPNCRDIILTHSQSLEFDRKRILLEFGEKELLTSQKLKLVRSILGLTLEDMSELLHIGKNTYGRWERDESPITYSMNLLVHNLIDRYPIAKNNLITSVRDKLLRECLVYLDEKNISLGHYMHKTIDKLHLHLDTIVIAASTDIDTLKKILFIQVKPEVCDPLATVKIAKFFQLSFENLVELLKASAHVFRMSSEISFVHTRKSDYSSEMLERQQKNISEVLEKAFMNEADLGAANLISEQYLARLKKCFADLEESA